MTKIVDIGFFSSFETNHPRWREELSEPLEGNPPEIGIKGGRRKEENPPGRGLTN
jgi:hypothetical protein